MTRCPTCGARRREAAPVCHRCRTDLSTVLAIEAAADRYRRGALAALAGGSAAQARACSERACALHRSADSVTVRALVALAERDFALALRLWREVRRPATRPPADPERRGAGIPAP